MDSNEISFEFEKTESEIEKRAAVNRLFEIYKNNVCAAVLPDNAGGYSFVNGFGNAGSSVVLIGEAPGKDEVLQGRPFVGQAGKILTHFLAGAGIERNDLYITNLIKYRLARAGKRPGTLANRPAASKEISFSSQYLKKEIGIISPRVIVTLGNVPLKGVDLAYDCGGLTLSESHGKLLKIVEETPLYLFPMYHPASTIYRPELNAVYEDDLKLFGEALREI